MFEPGRPSDLFDAGRGFDMLQELERNTPAEIARRRVHFRVAVKARVTLRPGNASERLKFKAQCVTGDLSEGGCRVLAPVPLRVGDIYLLDFDRQALDLPLTYARCVRCSLLREDAYESGFAFFSPVALPENLSVTEGDELT